MLQLQLRCWVWLRWQQSVWWIWWYYYQDQHLISQFQETLLKRRAIPLPPQNPLQFDLNLYPSWCYDIFLSMTNNTAQFIE